MTQTVWQTKWKRGMSQWHVSRRISPYLDRLYQAALRPPTELTNHGRLLLVAASCHALSRELAWIQQKGFSAGRCYERVSIALQERLDWLLRQQKTCSTVG